MAKKKVFVMLSGGVDSAVAALLLKKRGFAVTGVFMKNWSGFEGEDCGWQEDRLWAKKAATKLDIPFEVWDLEKEYKEKVIDYFFREYRAGRTPNPDVMCNKEIKFGLFFDRAMREGADFVATGHHARIQNLESRIKNKDLITMNHSPKGEITIESLLNHYQLLKGKDPQKDQSYFLWTLSQKQLAKTLMPVGEYKKEQIRQIANQTNLPNAFRPDSQGICFIGEVELFGFLKRKLPVKKGKIVGPKGKILGSHDGVWFYTEGQRQGLEVATGEPMHVVKKDLKTNTLFVGPKNDPRLLTKKFWATNFNFINPLLEKEIKSGKKIKTEAVLRYHHPSVKSQISLSKNQLEVTLSKPCWAVTPGQSVVFYYNDELLGGGIIEN